MIANVADFLAALFSAFTRQVILGFGLLFLLGALLYLFQVWTQRFLSRAIGWRGIVWWTGWLGTPIHEISHVVVATLTGVKVTEVKLFEPDPRCGVLGYVRYKVPRYRLQELHKVIGTFLMGVAPLFGGSLVLFGALWLLAPQPDLVFANAAEFAQQVRGAGPASIGEGFVALIQSVYAAVFAAGAADVRPWLFLYLALAVGAHLAPSRPDMEGGLGGLVTLCVLALFANAIALLLGYDPSRAAEVLATATGPLSALLLLALVLNCGNLALAVALGTLVPRLRARRE